MGLSGDIMQIANIIVNGGYKFREEAANNPQVRLSIFSSLATLLNSRKPSLDLVLFPAGFFCTPNGNIIPTLESTIKSLNNIGTSFTVVCGIDCWTADSKKKLCQGPEGYPFHVFVYHWKMKSPWIVQQVSSCADEGRDVAKIQNLWKNREIMIPGSEAALLICGETWSDYLLRKVVDSGARLLLVPAHQNINLMNPNMGGWANLSWHRRLNEFCNNNGIPVILSEHTRSPNRHYHCWGTGRPAILNLPAELSGRVTVKMMTLPP